MADWLLNMLPFEGWRQGQQQAQQTTGAAVATALPDSELNPTMGGGGGGGRRRSSHQQSQAQAGPSRIHNYQYQHQHQIDDEGDTDMVMDDNDSDSSIIDMPYPSYPARTSWDYSTSPRRNIPKSHQTSSSSFYSLAEPLSRQGSLPWSLDPDPPQWIDDGDRLAYQLFPITTQPPRIHSQSDPAIYKQIRYTPLPDPRVLREEELQGRIEQGMDRLARYSNLVGGGGGGRSGSRGHHHRRSGSVAAAAGGGGVGGRGRTRRELERTRERIRHELESDDEEEWDAEPEPSYHYYSETGSLGSLSSSSLSSSASTSSSSSMLTTPSPAGSTSNILDHQEQPSDELPNRTMKVYVGKFDLSGITEADDPSSSSSSSTNPSNALHRRRGPLFHAILLRLPAPEPKIHLFHPEHDFINGDTPEVMVRKRTYTHPISAIPGYLPATRYKIGKIPIECEDKVCDAIMLEVDAHGGGSDGKIWTARVMKELRKRAEGRWWIKKVKPVKRHRDDMLLDD